MTPYETKNTKTLGLLEKNICDIRIKWPTNKKCIKHWCVDLTTPIELPTNNNENETDIDLLFAWAVFLNQKAYKSSSKPYFTFNYSYLFTQIKNDIKCADLAIVNQETVFYINPEETKFSKKLQILPRK